VIRFRPAAAGLLECGSPSGRFFTRAEFLQHACTARQQESLALDDSVAVIRHSRALLHVVRGGSTNTQVVVIADHRTNVIRRWNEISVAILNPNSNGARSPAVRFAAAIYSIGFSKEAQSAGATDAVI
jgi:hypothetical protein